MEIIMLINDIGTYVQIADFLNVQREFLKKIDYQVNLCRQKIYNPSALSTQTSSIEDRILIYQLDNFTFSLRHLLTKIYTFESQIYEQFQAVNDLITFYENSKKYTKKALIERSVKGKDIQFILQERQRVNLEIAELTTFKRRWKFLSANAQNFKLQASELIKKIENLQVM